MGFFDFIFKKENTKKEKVLEWFESQVMEVLKEFPFLKDNPYEYRSMEDSELKRKAQIINESGELVDNSKNMSTRISRCELCIKMLFELCACFPTERQYAEALSNAINTMKELQPGYVLVPKDTIKPPTNDYGFRYEPINNASMPRTATVDGVPVYEYAETHKHDFQKMYECCVAELKEASRSKNAPAPYYFWRCAVLSKKAKRYDIEVTVCQSYLDFVDRYSAEMTAKGKRLGYDCLDMNGSPRVQDMRKRLPKAIANLEKARALPNL
ncbi:MAG: hypothetical protein AB9872_04065 [Solidesulfovibrio sp.]